MVLRRDQAKSKLHLWGTREDCDEAQHQLATLIRIESQKTPADTVELEPRESRWALHPTSDPTALNCSICWTEAETPIKTECGHIYCADCFSTSCIEGAKATAGLSIMCHGGRGSCKTAISMDDLQASLSSETLEKVLELSFESYIRRNPDKLRYCPTPDCDFIYRVTSQARILHCSNCIMSTCSACHENHTAMTCAERQVFASGGYAAFLKLKKDLGIKDCPKCRTPVERISGCNHMTCVVCQTHICWMCSQAFADGDAVYQHMEERHAGHAELPDL